MVESRQAQRLLRGCDLRAKLPRMGTRAALCLLAVEAVSFGSAEAETLREAYDACLAATIPKFEHVCGRADLIARDIIFECSPQLLEILRSAPLADDENEKVVADLLQFRLQHPCEVN